MNLINKLLIIITIFIATYLVFSLLKERQLIFNLSTKTEQFSLFGDTQSGEASSIKSQLTSNVSITDSNGDDNRPIKEYLIKASYNSAVSGNKVSTDMVNLVLSRGCRFLDFEVLIIDGQPSVTYTKDSDYLVREPENYIMLDTVLSTISSSAFAKPVPNSSDPLFIHLRVKSNDKSAFKKVALSIESTLAKTNKLYTYQHKPTPLVQHQREDKLNVAMQKAKFLINPQTSDFLMKLPNYIDFHADLSTKNKIAEQLASSLYHNKPNLKDDIDAKYNTYKLKFDILNGKPDHHFSALSGKYFNNLTGDFSSIPPSNSNDNNYILVPDTDLVNFFAFSPIISLQTVQNKILPSLNINNQIDSLSNVKLKDIKGKIVIILDNSNISNYNELTKCNSKDTNCFNINNYIFSNSNSNLFRKQKFSQLIESTCNSDALQILNGTSNTTKSSIAVPDTFSASNISNPDIRNLVFNFGIQIPCFKFYTVDNFLLIQEKLFNRYKTAFVPLEIVFNDLNKCNDYNELYRCYEND